MPRPSIKPSDQTTPILLTNLLRSHGGNLTSQKEEVLEDHRQEEAEEDNHLACQDRHQAEAEGVEEEEGEHSHYLGKHLPNLLKNS